MFGWPLLSFPNNLRAHVSAYCRASPLYARRSCSCASSQLARLLRYSLSAAVYCTGCGAPTEIAVILRFDLRCHAPCHYLASALVYFSFAHLLQRCFSFLDTILRAAFSHTSGSVLDFCMSCTHIERAALTFPSSPLYVTSGSSQRLARHAAAQGRLVLPARTGAARTQARVPLGVPAAVGWEEGVGEGSQRRTTCEEEASRRFVGICRECAILYR
eukprot:5408028-Pleurochrysis_carterae.AAC.2